MCVLCFFVVVYVCPFAFVCLFVNSSDEDRKGYCKRRGVRNGEKKGKINKRVQSHRAISLGDCSLALQPLQELQIAHHLNDSATV